MEQVITITPGGGVYGLAIKGGLDLRKLGKIHKERISDIGFGPETQMHYVCVRPNGLGVPEGPLTLEKMAEFGCERFPKPDLGGSTDTERLFWESYEDAVRAEVAFIQAVWRLV